LGRLTAVAHHIAEVVNIAPDPHQPFVGMSAFAHKAGLHTSAIARSRDAYEHVAPESVGNGTRFVVSEMAGRSTVALKAEQLGLALDDACWPTWSNGSRSSSTAATTSRWPTDPSNC
jgi:2-isopropylmalate synthase